MVLEIGRELLTGCYKLYLLAVMLLSNQTSQTWQWKIPAFTDDFPNSTYTLRRFSIAMFVDHNVLLFFFFLCVCVCHIGSWRAKWRSGEPPQKKGIGSHTLAKVCKADSGAIWNWNYRDLKNGVDMGSRRENMGVWVNNQFYNMFLLHSERF